MSEKFADIRHGDGDSTESTRFNTSVYNHYGMGELYDHVFIELNEQQGAYIWAQIPPENPAYTALARIAVEGGAELHLNLRKVSENDLKAFGRAALADLDEIPEWL